jgi:hypothetical protein
MKVSSRIRLILAEKRQRAPERIFVNKTMDPLFMLSAMRNGSQAEPGFGYQTCTCDADRPPRL